MPLPAPLPTVVAAAASLLHKATPPRDPLSALRGGNQLPSALDQRSSNSPSLLSRLAEASKPRPRKVGHLRQRGKQSEAEEGRSVVEEDDPQVPRALSEAGGPQDAV